MVKRLMFWKNLSWGWGMFSSKSHHQGLGTGFTWEGRLASFTLSSSSLVFGPLLSVTTLPFLSIISFLFVASEFLCISFGDLGSSSLSLAVSKMWVFLDFTSLFSLFFVFSSSNTLEINLALKSFVSLNIRNFSRPWR